MADFKEKLAEILEVDSINDSDVLKDFEEWDSLTSLSIIAAIDGEYKINISAEELTSFNTVGDLLQHIKAKTGK